MKGKWQKRTAIPTLNQVETEWKRYRWKKAYFRALRGTISVLTYVAAGCADRNIGAAGAADRRYEHGAYLDQR